LVSCLEDFILLKKYQASHFGSCYKLYFLPFLYPLPTEIAIKTAQASKHIQDIQTMEKCWFETFYSDSTVVNYLRLYVDDDVVEKYEKLAEKRIKSLGACRINP
jgi:hypothetical protein